MATRVLIFAAETPSKLYGIEQTNNKLNAYSGCCEAPVTCSYEEVTCTLCGCGKDPKLVEILPLRLDPDGTLVLAPSFALSDNQKVLPDWIKCWTGLEVKVTVED